MINVNQIALIYNNQPQLKLYNFIKEEDFFILLLNHLKNHFAKFDSDLEFSTPYFNELGYTSDSSYLHVNNEEFGQLFLLKDHITKQITLFLYSEPLNVKYYLLEDDNFKDITFSKYSFFLESLFSFSATLEQLAEE